MTKLKIKTGDTVKVIAGDHKGEEGKVVKGAMDVGLIVGRGGGVVVLLVEKRTLSLKPKFPEPLARIRSSAPYSSNKRML